MSLEDRLPFLKKITENAPQKLKDAAERVKGRDVVDVFTSFELEDIESIIMLGGKPIYDTKYTHIYMKEKNLKNTQNLEGCISFKNGNGQKSGNLKLMFEEGNEEIAEETDVYELYDEDDEDYYKYKDLEIKKWIPKRILMSGNLVKHTFKKPREIKYINFEKIEPAVNFFNFLDKDDWKMVILAGGSVIGNLVGIDFFDYDLFFHNCTIEEANDIIRKFHSKVKETGYKFATKINGNVITFLIGKMQQKWDVKIQFILRIYSSISQIIHGFDIDCSCAAYDCLSEMYYLTERAIYSIEQGCNTLNFEKLSPSYEHRLGKNLNRGMNCHIPFAELLKQGYSIGELRTEKNAGTLLKYPLEEIGFKFKLKSSFIPDYEIEDQVKNEGKNEGTRYDRQNLEFKVQNPDEQSIGTFHRIVLENKRLWYQQQTPKLEKTEILDKVQNLKVEYLLNENTIVSKFLKKNPGVVIVGSICRKILQGIEGKGETLRITVPNSNKAKKFLAAQDLVYEFIDAKFKEKFSEQDDKTCIRFKISQLDFEDFCNFEGNAWENSFKYYYDNFFDTEPGILKIMLERDRSNGLNDEEYNRRKNAIKILDFFMSYTVKIPRINIHTKNYTFIEEIFEENYLTDYEKCAAYWDQSVNRICVTYPPELEKNIKDGTHTSTQISIDKLNYEINKNSFLISKDDQEQIMNSILN